MSFHRTFNLYSETILREVDDLSGFNTGCHILNIGYDSVDSKYRKEHEENAKQQLQEDRIYDC